MKRRSITSHALVNFLVFFLALLSIPLTSHAAFTIKVTGNTVQKDPATGKVLTTSSAPLNDFKWLVQEDNTWDAVGHVGQFNNYSSLSVSIHKSHAKVLASGTSANPVVNLPSSGRYFVSVLSPNHYSIGGGPVRPGQTEVNIVVNKFPVPLAQITVLVFRDNAPINGAPDLPNETPLGGMKVFLFDQLGQQSQDAFGNPIGTIYQSDPVTGQPVLDPNGNAILVSKGPGYVLSQPDFINAGFSYNAVVPNLAPGKYGIWVQPADGKPWIQTSTIEGTPGIDNWVVAGEPNFFTEVGFFGVHSFLGFVLPTDYPDPLAPVFRALNPGEVPGNVTGQVVQNRINRPPLQMGLNPGDPVPNPYIGLSDINAGNQAVFVMACPGTTANGSTCDANSKFTIKGVPPGTYTLTMWDKPLDQLIDFRTITVPATLTATTGDTVPVEPCPAGDTNYPFCPSPVFQWFGTLEGCVAQPGNDCTPGKLGYANQLMDLRFRDGSIYQTTLTNADGTYSFPEVFPFFKYLVAGVDAVSGKPLGAAAKVDKGGPFVPPWSSTGNNTIPLLDQPTFLPGTQTLAHMLYMSETNVINWFKSPYAPGETGYIAGMVSYAFTRASGDPALGAQSPWEPGIPNVVMKLYKVTGYETNGKPIFDRNSPIATVLTDSWDRAVFEENSLIGCRQAMTDAGININAGGIPLDKYIDCSETMPIWNQVKQGVYDGAYIFFTDDAGNRLAAGDYVVEAVTPPGYEVIKEEDQNFIVSGPGGSDITPSVPQPAAVPPPCVGPDHVVPAFLAYDGVTPAPFAGQTRPLCTMKLAKVQAGQNIAMDFRFFTPVEPAGRMVGLVTDDLTLEFRAGNPRLGDKIGPSFMPISVQDFAGNELVRTYTDEWGQYNTLVPSTFWTNTPNPTGVSPHMVVVVLNPQFLADPVTRRINPALQDQFFKPGYPTATFNFDFWPGKITYVDTPIVPIRPAIDTTPLDCGFNNGTPVISQVNGPAGGPWVEFPTPQSFITITSPGNVPVPNPDQTVGGTITRDYGFGPGGDVYVTPLGAEFDSPGTKKLKVLAGGWTTTAITALTVTLNPDGTDGAVLVAGAYQLTIVRSDNHKPTITGITLHVGTPAAKVRKVVCDPTGATSPIQDAIDAADNGDLILVGEQNKVSICPENVIMWKPVKLQGYGAGWPTPTPTPKTMINAGFFTPDKQAAWLAKINAITNGQAIPSPWLIDAQQPDFFLESGSAVLVLAPNAATANLMNNTPPTINPYDNGANKALIDGFAMSGANLGGAIFVNANAHYIQISNNKLYANNATYGGGIRVGTPTAISANAPNVYEASHNDHVTIAHNEISFNGATGFAIGSGGGIGLFKGADDYLVSDNWVCGNFALLAGAGIAQQGVSSGSVETDPVNNNAPVFDPVTQLPVFQKSVITRNTIIFNESFDEGAGIFLAGELPIAAAAVPANTVTEGVGNVVIDANLIQGNKAGNLGGGIALFRYNGQDVANNNTNAPPVPNAVNPVPWYKAEVYNNMIVNNISAGFGGGIATFDALDVTIANNTVANNDSTATGELAFGNTTITLDGADQAFTLPANRQTTPMPAGIGVQPLSATLLGQIAAGPVRDSYTNTYAKNPVIVNDIIYGNKSYFWPGFDPNVNAGVNILAPFAIWDLGVFTDPPGVPGLLNPQYSVLTETSATYPQVKHYAFTGAGLVKTTDAQLVSTYRNSISATQGGAALGNFVSFTYSPLTLTGNYHIKGTSPARGVGSAGAPVFSWNAAFLGFDFDGDSRVAPVDIGADQVNTKGDLNSDGIVNGLDALIALQMAVGVYPAAQVTDTMLFNVRVAPLSTTGKPNPNGYPPGSYNPPGSNPVTIADALLIMQRAIGLIFW